MSDLVGNPEDRFSRVEAHLLLCPPQLKLTYLVNEAFDVIFRRIVSQEEHHVTLATNVETATGTDEAIATDGKELSEKEKLSLSYNDEKDDCEAQDLDWDSDNDVSCSPDNNAECSLDSDIQCSPDNDIPRNPDKEVEETGIVENRIDPENGERVVASEPEGSAADKLEVDVQEGRL